MRSFVKEYFDTPNIDRLKTTITPNWSVENVENHLRIVKPEGNRIYEIGAGIGRLLDALKDKHIVSGCDASQAMIKNQLPGCNISICDGKGSIPCETASQDFVFSIIVFQHIPDIEVVKEFINEAYRILESGSFVFQVFSHYEKDSELWTYHDHDELLSAMDSAGFKTIIEKGDRWTVFRGVK